MRAEILVDGAVTSRDLVSSSTVRAYLGSMGKVGIGKVSERQ